MSKQGGRYYSVQGALVPEKEYTPPVVEEIIDEDEELGDAQFTVETQETTDQD